MIALRIIVITLLVGVILCLCVKYAEEVGDYLLQTFKELIGSDNDESRREDNKRL